MKPRECPHCHQPINEASDLPASRTTDWLDLLRAVTPWLITIPMSALLISFLALLFYWFWWKQDWLMQIVLEHFKATVILPIIATVAYVLVTILEIRSGPLEFEVLGLKLKGGAGPAVIWILALLAGTLATQVLW